MILYFSGTGNSRYIAKKVAKETEDTCISINTLMKTKNFDSLISETKPFVFVCPIYAWRIPKVLNEFLEKISFEGNLNTYFIVTCGGESANAIAYIEELCKKKGMNLLGFSEVVMPDNYIIMFPSLEKEEIEKRIESASSTQHLSKLILSESPFPPFKVKEKWKSGAVNSLFYKLFVKAKGFHINSKCISCGKCVQLCPLNNISMNEETPIWGNNCTHCMACVGGCPKQAIEYKNKTQNKTRYYLD